MDPELKKLQQRELDMLKKVLKILERNKITYYALGGTLLGAVRHKGFIPWDDDIDIGIPRPQYEKFLKVASSELPDNYVVSMYKTPCNQKRPVYACQIMDKNTKILQHIANKPIETHVWIDIFPLDGMPDNVILRKFHSIRLLFSRMMLQFSMFDENVHQYRKNRAWYERMLIKFYTITKFGKNKDTYKCMDKIDKNLKKYSYDNSRYIINFMGAWKLKEMFPKIYYGRGKLYQFEDIQINGPDDSDSILTKMYGDYYVPVKNETDKNAHHYIEIIKL